MKKGEESGDESGGGRRDREEQKRRKAAWSECTKSTTQVAKETQKHASSKTGLRPEPVVDHNTDKVGRGMLRFTFSWCLSVRSWGW